MGDRIVVMDKGIVQQNDTPLTLYNQPVNLFVAGFLGSPPMNFLHGTLKQEKDALLFREMEGGTVEVRLNATERPAARELAGKPVIMGVRPEDIDIAQFTKGQETAGSFPAIIDLVEPMGAETNLYLQTGAHTVVCRTQRPLDHRDAGHRMQFEMDLAKVHLFDPTTTLRIV